MTFSSIVKDALRVAIRVKPLWLFGFFVGLGNGGGGGGGGGAGGVPQAGGSAALAVLVPIVIAIVVVALAVLFMRLLSEGALIEGVRRHVRGETLTVRQGFRDGAANVVVVLLIKVIYVAVSLVSLLLLALPFLLVVRLAGMGAAATAIAVAAALVAVPWLLTLYIWQAFALRIAVLENRHTMDAMQKARLFLHGRLLHGLKLMLAMFLGTLLIVLVSLVLIGPLVLGGVLLARNFSPSVFFVVAPIAVAALCVSIAIAGTFQSSVWTLGYLRQVEA